MSGAADERAARRAARRLLVRLPPRVQVGVRRAVVRSRRRARAACRGRVGRLPLLEVPGADDAGPVLLVALGEGAHAEGVAAEAAARRAGGESVLVVTDRDDFGPFRRRDVLFEYVPPADDWAGLADPPLRYGTFLARRLAAIRAAWRPVRVEAAAGTRLPGRPEGAGSRCILVATSVHQAEDPRIRRRTVGVLARHARVRYATRTPGPADLDDHQWVALHGGRLRRVLGVAREAWRRDVGMVSLHDPELLPVGLVVRALRRVPVVFDVHEDVPAQIATKPWLPRPVRRPLARAAAWLLRRAERHLVVTLAEPNYARLFRRDHPVLPNYPDVAALPAPAPDGGSIVYLGDVTEPRGASLAVRAVAGLDPPRRLRLVGRCAPDLAARLRALAAELGVDLELPGFLPHPEAMAVTARATVGIAPLADIPNYRDSLPTKTLEYLALGVPVVASDLPGTRKVIGELPGVQLAEPADVHAWTAALQRTCDDPAWREAARGNADAVRARFTWPAEALWAVYAPHCS